MITDSCLVRNGGCPINSISSHDAVTNAVRCGCKPGYTNTGAGNNTVCTGKREYSCSLFEAIQASSTFSIFVDACQVKNGGCDVNALCSHDATNNAVLCTCKAGYTNTGSGETVVCTGEVAELRATINV